MDAILWGLGIGVIGGFFYILVNRLRWRREQAQQDVEVQQRRAERDAYWGFNAQVQTATAEEIAQAEKDRRDFFSLLGDNGGFPYLGTALYNNAQEQTILEEARRAAAAKEAEKTRTAAPERLKYHLMEVQYDGGTIDYSGGTEGIWCPATEEETSGSLKDGLQTCSNRKWGTITAAEAAGTVTPEQRAAAETLRRQSFGGTPDPKEYRP